jgi:integrase
MTDQAIADVVRAYRDRIGESNLGAHDLRRTFAKLAHKGGAALEQDLTQAPRDMLGLRLAGK